MISYFLAANCYGLLFYCLYQLLLKGRSSHSWNRGYLLAVALLALILPLARFQFDGWSTIGVVQTLRAVTLPEVTLTAAGSETSPPWYVALASAQALYLIVMAAFLLRFAYRFFSLQLFLRKQQFVKHEGFRLALNTGVGPASFGNVILFPGAEADANILNHEKAHLQHRHHYDKFLMQLLQCFFFPAIPLFFIARELALVHEFEADAIAGRDRKSYIQTLLSRHFETQQFPLLQSFFHHPLKRRIMMLQRSYAGKSNRFAKGLVVLGSAVLSGTIVLAQSLPPSIAQNVKRLDQLLPVAAQEVPKAGLQEETVVADRSVSKPIASAQHNTQSPNTPLPGGQPATAPDQEEPVDSPPVAPAPEEHTESDTRVFTTAEQMPKPPFDVAKYLTENIRYPEDAKQENIQGRTILQFVVDRDGSVTDVVVQRDIGGGCGAEALRVVKSMPKWTPGRNGGQPVRVYYTLPVSFKLEQTAVNK